MSSTGGIAAIVLAAGKSSRMGTSKSLLQMGNVTAIERVLASVTQAAVDDVVVVTGHDPDRIVAIIDRLPVRRVHNAEYESGMFSSVRAGVRALSPGTEALMIVPADYPLIGTRVLDELIDGFREDDPGVLHPVCCGHRGHPPLISGRIQDAVLRMDNGATLRDFFLEHREDEVEVEVEDLSILMDMDTDEDYQRLSRFAGFRDATSSDQLSSDDALYLLSLLEVPDRLVRHCRAVATVGETLVEALRPRQAGLDAGLVRTAGLLHDMAKARPKHAVVAQHILSNLGLTRLGEVVGAHMVLPPEQLRTLAVTEEQVVYLADKLVIDDRVAGFTERAARALSRPGQDDAALEGVRSRMRTAQMIQEKIETILERSLDEVLARA